MLMVCVILDVYLVGQGIFVKKVKLNFLCIIIKICYSLFNIYFIKVIKWVKIDKICKVIL